MNTIVCAALLAALVVAQPDKPRDVAGLRQNVGAPMPDWFPAHVEYMTRQGGVWEADNSSYRSAAEPFHAYRVEFEPAFDGWSFAGRLYGVETSGSSPDFWHFRAYWDAAANAAVLDQWGWGGAMGEGVLVPIADDAPAGSMRASQRFAAPGLPVRTEAHDFLILGADTHETRSYTVSADGRRAPNRTYTWRRVTD
ncbi:hypothetical protein [Maricaulis sp. CAU 1757]